MPPDVATLTEIAPVYPPPRTTWIVAVPAVSVTDTVAVAKATWAGVVTLTAFVVAPVKPVLATDRATAPFDSVSVNPLNVTSPFVGTTEVVPPRVAPIHPALTR